jgi:uncharacterized SAM-binding protein YcdF (DUF218 family)
MPSASSRRRRPSRRRYLLIFFVLLCAGLAWTFVSLGRILHHEDQLARAELIFVLAGRRVERVAEAGDLYLEGWAPRILLSRELMDAAEATLRARGLELPAEIDVQRSVLLQMGVPATAIDALTVEQVTTATESDELRRLALEHGWRRVIVVTSKMHTARARLAFRRTLADTPVEIIMRASRYDEANIDQWWQSRSDLRFALVEAQKMVAYWVGIGG